MKLAGVMLIVKDGLILSISRRNDRTKFGLPGGKAEEGEQAVDAAIRETLEETSIQVKKATLIYHRVEPADSPTGMDFHSYCFYAEDWFGVPSDSEEGEVKWLTPEEVTDSKAAFGLYNTKMLQLFQEQHPEVYLAYSTNQRG